MEIGILETAVAIVSGGVSAGLTYKFFSEKLAGMEATMKECVRSEKCEMRHKGWEDRCAITHGNLKDTMDRIDKKFEEICERIADLKTERKTEIAEITALLREYFNESGGKRK